MKKSILLSAILLSGFSATQDANAAQNLVFNSGFELGDAGFQCVKYLDVLQHPDAKYIAPVADPDTRVSGRRSLRISTPYGEKVIFYGKELKLKPGGDYTFSCSMKTDMEGLKVSAMYLSPTETSGWHPCSKELMPGKDWQRFSFSFKTKTPPWPNEYYTLFISFGCEQGAPGSLWLDDLQLEEGQGSPYAPSREIEAAVVSEKPFYIEGKDKAARLELRAVNYGKSAASPTLNLDLVDEAGGQRLFSKAFTPSLKPDEPVAIPCEAPLSRFGTFSVEVSAKGLRSFDSFPGYFLAAGAYERKPLDLAKRFCMGFNWGGVGFKAPFTWGSGSRERAFECACMGPDDFIEMSAALGARFFRSPALWNQEEPEEGVFNFREPDYVVELLERHGDMLFPTVLSSAFILSKGSSSWPKWLAGKCQTVEKSGQWKKTVAIPPVDCFKNYFRAYSSRYKGRLTHYEIVNEPNGFLSAEAYMPFLKAAHEVAREIDPAAKIVGFCSTGDMGGDSTGFTETCASLGGLDYANAVSFHPYDSVSLGFQTPAEKTIDAGKETIRKSLGSPDARQLWNTELFYLRSDLVGKGHWIRAKHEPFEYAWRALTDLGEGVAQSNFLELSQTGRNRYAPHFLGPGALATTDEPGPDMAVCSAIARHFEGAKPIGKFKNGCDSVIYAYERDGELKAALWSYGDFKKLSVSISQASNENASLFDIFGNKLPLDGKAICMTPSPLYLEWKGGDKDAFLAALKNAKVEADKPLSVGAARLMPGPAAGAWIALVSIRNLCPETLSGDLGVNGKGVVGTGIVEFSIPPCEEKALSVPVKLEVSGPSEIVVKASANGKIWDFHVKLEAAPKTYPAGGRKDGASIQSIDGGKASFSISYDEKFLRLSFKVKDSIASGAPNGRDPWEQDCIELFIDAAPKLLPQRHPELYTEKVARLFILPYAPRGERLLIWPQGLEKLTLKSVEAETSLVADGYTATLAIPLEALELQQPLNGKSIGFDVGIDYADSTKRISSESWNSKGEAFKNRLRFGIVTFS